MTPQEVFNNALFGVRAQDYMRSTNERLSCQYRGAMGRKCHIGHSIRDEDYSPDMEGEGAASDMISSLFPDIDIRFLEELQRIHDVKLHGCAVESYEREMRDFAKWYSLEYTAP